jgi:hypothetical protein
LRRERRGIKSVTSAKREGGRERERENARECLRLTEEWERRKKTTTVQS